MPVLSSPNMVRFKLEVYGYVLPKACRNINLMSKEARDLKSKRIEIKSE